MELRIEVTKDELLQAAENLVFEQNLDRHTVADEEAIALIIKHHLENEIEERLSNPEKHLKPNEWQEVNQCFHMEYFAYQKMMDRDIPYPL